MNKNAINFLRLYPLGLTIELYFDISKVIETGLFQSHSFESRHLLHNIKTGKDVHPWTAAISLGQSFLTRLGYCRRMSKRFIRHKIEFCNFHWFIMERSLTKVHDVMMITENEFSYTGNKSFANFKHGKMAISWCCNGIGMITCLLSCWKDKILLISFHQNFPLMLDENRIFPVEAILKHKKVVCTRRKMPCTVFKYLFSLQRYSSF